MTSVLGWDIGGAHLKLARLEAGRLTDLVQLPCALWQGLDRLDAAIDSALHRLPPVERHAVTMTGEMVDLFDDRTTGVTTILMRLRERLVEPIAVYAADGGFITPDQASTAPGRVASANWHATASMLARCSGDGVLLDIGSTTTDIVPVRAGRPVAAGFGDAARLATGELVYTGVVRTPVMAVARHLPVGGKRHGVMAELFATMADVYRVTGELPAHADQHPTADGRGKTIAESCARLARMVGCDSSALPEEIWLAVARALRSRQCSQIVHAARRVQSRASLAMGTPLVGAGVGRFLGPQLAQRLGRPYVSFARLIDAPPPLAEAAADAAPAAAVAWLAART